MTGPATTTIDDVKAKIQNKFDIPASDQKLVFLKTVLVEGSVAELLRFEQEEAVMRLARREAARQERRAQRVRSRVQAQELARVLHVWLLYAAARRRLDLSAHRLCLRACVKQQACARAALQAWSSLHHTRARPAELAEMQAQSAQASICELNRQVDDARRCSQLLDRQVAALEQELQESKRREALAHAATEHILFELREHILLELHAAHECVAWLRTQADSTVASLRQQEEEAHETARRCAEAVSKPLYGTS